MVHKLPVRSLKTAQAPFLTTKCTLRHPVQSLPREFYQARSLSFRGRQPNHLIAKFQWRESLLTSNSPAPDTEPICLAFTHPGTVETGFDLKILSIYCNDRPLCCQKDAQDEYQRVFAARGSFTFVQRQETALPPPMEWKETGEDESGRFSIFVPALDSNPYYQYKASHFDSLGRIFEFHTFYHDPAAAFAPNRLMLAMLQAGVVSVVGTFPFLC